MRTSLLGSGEDEAYESLVKGSKAGTLFQSTKYRDLLLATLGCESRYLVARQGDKFVGALPCMLKPNKQLGGVLNSLPFYGSHGGCVLSRDSSSAEALQVKKSLLKALSETATEEDALSSTIVASPFDDSQRDYLTAATMKETERRVAQMVHLPAKPEDLFPSYTKSCRNAIAHAEKLGVSATWDASQGTARRLHEGQKENMGRLGGVAKPESFFSLLSKTFEPGDDYRIYSAEAPKGVAALLLVFYYKGVVEYYTPVTYADFRALSPMNLLVHEVATDAVARGYRFLNFGGTSASQGQLHKFKSSFGAKDHPYGYYTAVRAKTVRGLTEEKLIAEYPWFYALPFSMLEKNPQTA